MRDEVLGVVWTWLMVLAVLLVLCIKRLLNHMNRRFDTFFLFWARGGGAGDYHLFTS